MGAVIGIVISVLLFSIFGHELWVLGVFMIIFLTLLAYFNVREAMAAGTVLITQIYSSNMANTAIITNEIALLMIGIGIAWLLNLHMLDIESEIKEHYEATPLPVNREEFESRAVFFQFMNDIAYFKKIKMVFITKYGGFRYCGK